MRRFTVLPAVILFGVLIPDPSAAQLKPGDRIEVSKLGPQVGDPVPGFNLPDQNGKKWNLQSIMGPKGAMLVFLRSADW